MIGLLRTRALAALLCAATLGACSNLTGPEGDLRSARRRWAARGPDAYQFTLERSCFCVPETTRPVIVSVRGGVVESRRYADTGAPVDPRWADVFPTIDGLFAVIDSAFARRADRVSVTYDEALGYPLLIRIDYVTNAVDDEVDWGVRDLRAE